MARSRNIKPAFFANDILAELEPIDRLLFIGLWTICDFKGELELRPKKIKAQVLPYDNCNIDKIIANLCESRFITTYNVNGIDYLNITNFVKHQNPHPNEKKAGSSIPSMHNTSKNSSQDNDNITVITSNDKTLQASCEQPTNHAESLIPHPETLKKKSENKFSKNDVFLAKFLLSKIESINPNFKKPNLDKWSDVFRLMREADERDELEIKKAIDWISSSDFWQGNILSPQKLREHFDRLLVQMNLKKKQEKIAWQKIPVSDEELASWAIKHGFKLRSGESYPQTRARFKDIIAKKIQDGKK